MHIDYTITQADNEVSAIERGTRLAGGIQGLFAGQKIERFEADAPIFREGDLAEHVIFIAEGMVRIFKLMGDGRRVVIGFIGAGSLLSASPGLRRQVCVDAVNDTKLWRLCQLRFDDEINSLPKLRSELLVRMCDEMTAAQGRMALLALKNEEERMSRFLLALSRRTFTRSDELQSVEIPTNRDISDYLGLKIDVVARYVEILTARGIIIRSGRHTAMIWRPNASAMMIDIQAEPRNDAYHEMSARQAVWP
jgi:CRP/FNR family transcriptional regulator